jgi:hypothetical protein
MDGFRDPARQRVAAAKGLATRRQWAALKAEMKRGRISPRAALEHPAAQAQTVLAVTGFMFGRADRAAAGPLKPQLAHAGLALSRMEGGCSPSLLVRHLSPARRDELALIVVDDGSCAWTRARRVAA